MSYMRNSSIFTIMTLLTKSVPYLRLRACSISINDCSFLITKRNKAKSYNSATCFVIENLIKFSQGSLPCIILYIATLRCSFVKANQRFAIVPMNTIPTQMMKCVLCIIEIYTQNQNRVNGDFTLNSVHFTQFLKGSKEFRTIFGQKTQMSLVQ